MCVFARSVGASVDVIDVGVGEDLHGLDGVVHAKVASGSANMAERPAMTEAERDAALQVGRAAVQRALDDGVRLLALGEMGIGNTTAAALLTACVAGSQAAAVTGRGTGLDDQALAHKCRIVERCLARIGHTDGDAAPGDAGAAAELLRQVGGLEVAALVGAMLAAAERRLPVLVDGYIVTAAALVACAMDPRVRDCLLFAHRSAEPGHRLALEHLAARPLLVLDMCLGEGSAATLAIALVRAAAAMMCDMASFDSAGVDRGTDP